MDKEEKLQEVVKNSISDQSKVIEALKKGWKATGFWNIEERKALHDFFINNDINGAKQHFFLCGIIDEFEITKLDQPILDYGLNHIGYVLLSDSKALIERYSNLKHSYYEKMIINGSSSTSYIIQCLMKDDWAEFERVMPIMKTKTLKKYPVMQLDYDFFEALAERNKAKLEGVLASFVTPKIHNQRNKHHILLNEFISHPALGYAKLAWLKGIEVEVNSPLIPKELLPVKPLDEYHNEYSFLYDIPLKS